MNRRAGAVRATATLTVILIVAVTATWNRANAAKASKPFPDPVVDVARVGNATEKTAVLAGGCFWGIQAVFQHVKGVQRAISGYSGGLAATARYDLVSRGDTGHAESVEITFDPAQVSYGQLLKVFFSVAHDPTQVNDGRLLKVFFSAADDPAELNGQDPDIGAQYRSLIFYGDEEQEHVAQAYISQLQEAKWFRRPIATQVVPLEAFYTAENYHQNYAKLHPDDEYIWTYDAPKIDRLRKQLPDLYKQ